MNRVTQAEFARLAGVNRSTVTRWLQSGRIQLDASGLIDAQAAHAMREDTASQLPHHQARKAGIELAKQAAAAASEPSGTLDIPQMPSDAPAGSGSALPPNLAEPSAADVNNRYKLAMAREREAKAELAAMEVDKLAGSRIEMEYLKSDMRQYHVPCPHCGEFQVLHWKHPDGRYGLTHLAASGRVVYTCSECGSHIDEHHKPAMLARGRWIPRHPERPVRGYQLSGLYSPLGLGFTWAEIWDKWTEAHGDTAKLKRFVNTTLAEVWEEAGDSIEDISLISRLEDYPEVLPVLARTAWVDVQKDRLEMSVIDWGDHEESWLHDHVILPGDTAQQDVWDALADEVDGLGLDAMGVDAGYNAPQVHAFVLNKKWCYATKGMPGMQRAIVDDEQTRRKRLRKRLRRKVVVEPIGVDSAKALIYARLKQDKPGKGTVHFPRRPAFDDEYFAQVASEKLVPRVRGTRPYQEWVQTRPRNEALDCLVGNLAVLRIAVDLEALRVRANAGERVHKATLLEAAERQAAGSTTNGAPPVTKKPQAQAAARAPHNTDTGGWDFERRS